MGRGHIQNRNGCTPPEVIQPAPCFTNDDKKATAYTLFGPTGKKACLSAMEN
jgi:hypothetical protein